MMNFTMDVIFFNAINPDTGDAMHLSRTDRTMEKKSYSFFDQGNKIFPITRNKLVLNTSCPIKSYNSETEKKLSLIHFTYTKKIQKHFSN